MLNLLPHASSLYFNATKNHDIVQLELRKLFRKFHPEQMRSQQCFKIIYGRGKVDIRETTLSIS